VLALKSLNDLTKLGPPAFEGPLVTCMRDPCATCFEVIKLLERVCWAVMPDGFALPPTPNWVVAGETFCTSTWIKKSRE
jgi:hypothetical protein